MGPFQPPRPQSNGKNAAIFFVLTLVVFALPLLMPNHSSHPAFSRTPSAQSPSPAAPEAPTAALAAASPTPTHAATPSLSSATPSAGSTPSPAATAPLATTATPSATPSASGTPEAPLAAATPAVATSSKPAKPADGELDWSQDYGPQINFKEKLQSIIINLFIITGLIFLTVKFLQKFYPNVGKLPAQATPLMQVLSTTTISPGINLCLVQVCNKNMVLAITEHSVSSICEISEEELAKAREQSEISSGAVGPMVGPLAKSPKQVYGDILRHYLSIIPGVGGKQ
jgi:flagellar biogenesis protein FliO